MLESGDPLGVQVQELINTVGPLQSTANLPWWWKGDGGPTGLLPAKHDEQRRHPRYHYRVCAALEHRQTFPSLPRPQQWHLVFTKDLSRGGLGFLHSEQLFPCERLRVMLPWKGIKLMEIVTCIRIHERCFQTGARFLEPVGDGVIPPLKGT
jgi:hypothetical protein